MAKKASTSDGKPRPNSTESAAREPLRSFIERIERLEAERKSIADDIKDVYGEAKGTGFEPKVIRKLVAERKQDRDELMEFEAILDTYRLALGMIPSGDMRGDDEGEGEEDTLV